jgi:hypothetical protein
MVTCGVGAALALAASATPVFGADNGTVNAQVRAAAAPTACITVPAATVDFGTRPFNPAGASNVAQAAAITVKGCATGNGMVLLARGTNATGPIASWALTADPMCPAGAATAVDQYNLGLLFGSNTNLTTTDSVVYPQLGPTEEFTASPTITMPCVGSSGAGELMSMSYVFTATLP